MTPVVATATRVETGVPVTFACKGFRLVGSLHQATRQATHGVILLNQGPVDRGGSHRVYVKLANRLAEMGIPVLRFDARGVGDSEGAWEGENEGISILDVYGHIQRGAWTEDAAAAIDYMIAKTGVRKIILGGLCGGATTALFAGAEHPAVDGVFVIGTPVTFSSVTRRTADLPDAIIERDSATYLKKIFNLTSWKRFLSMETDYKTLVHVFRVQLHRRWQRIRGIHETPDTVNENVNMPLLSAVTTACRKRKSVLFVYGTNDYLWQEFQEHLPRFGRDRSKLPFELVTIPDANHILTEDAWQQAMFDSVCAFTGRLTRAGRE